MNLHGFTVTTIFLFSLRSCQEDKPVTPANTITVQESIDYVPASFAVEELKAEEAYRVEENLPTGYVKDGSKDYTFFIQEAIDKHKVLVFPAFPVRINDMGLQIGSNRTITFPKGSELRLEATDQSKYAIINIKNAKNTKLYNPVIVGDRKKHLGSKGEWGMGIQIRASENIEIINPRVTECWGDGIYVAGSPERGPSRNITIVNAYCKDNLRNGISIVSVDGLKMLSPYSGYNDGTDPKSGIDIEPNRPEDLIKNIRIVNPQTEHNPGTGISIGINKLYGKGDRNVGIRIEKPVDIGSQQGMLISCSKDYSKQGEKVSGVIEIIDPVWKYNAKHAFGVYKLREPALQFTLTNPKVTDPNGKALTKEAFMQATRTSAGSYKNYVMK